MLTWLEGAETGRGWVHECIHPCFCQTYRCAMIERMMLMGLFQIVLPPLLRCELPVFEAFCGFFDELVEGGEVPYSDGIVT